MRNVFTLLVSLLFLPVFAQEKITFRKKKKESRTFSVPLYQSCSARMKSGKRIAGFLQSQSDSTLLFRANLSRKATWKRKEVKAIMGDSALSHDQKNQKLLEMMYPDKVPCPYDSIRRMRFPIAPQKLGVLRVAGGSLLFATGAYVFMSSVIDSDEPGALQVSPVIGAGALLVGGTVFYFVTNKIIRPEKWELVRK